MDTTKIKNIRKRLIEIGIKYQKRKDPRYLVYLAQVARPIANKMFHVIYNFLLKASMLNLLKDYFYSNNQRLIESFLREEINKEFYVIKNFLICIMDSRLTFGHINSLDLIFTKEFIIKHNHKHVCDILEFIKNKEELRDYNYSFESHVQIINHTIDFYKILQENILDKIESKIANISKALNVMHNTGYCFFNVREIDNFLPVFTFEQKNMFSNISATTAEKELKKLLF